MKIYNDCFPRGELLRVCVLKISFPIKLVYVIRQQINLLQITGLSRINSTHEYYFGSCLYIYLLLFSIPA